MFENTLSVFSPTHFVFYTIIYEIKTMFPVVKVATWLEVLTCLKFHPVGISLA